VPWPLRKVRHLEIVGSGVEVLFCDMSDVSDAMSRFSPAGMANMNELEQGFDRNCGWCAVPWLREISDHATTRARIGLVADLSQYWRDMNDNPRIVEVRWSVA
jgi:hypothetical protein